ncbi:MAG: hypothetical protein OWS74_07120, partial [Firmicutes bacterium]|nr:hypothetical protein [Bacillota bacterium]
TDHSLRHAPHFHGVLGLLLLTLVGISVALWALGLLAVVFGLGAITFAAFGWHHGFWLWRSILAVGGILVLWKTVAYFEPLIVRRAKQRKSLA